MPTDPETGARYRLNAKQSVKNIWTLDCTIEYKDDTYKHRPNPNDEADIQIMPLGAKLLAVIKAAEHEFRVDRRILAGDNNV